jgi:hypothetical protein
VVFSQNDVVKIKHIPLKHLNIKIHRISPVILVFRRLRRLNAVLTSSVPCPGALLPEQENRQVQSQMN